MPKTIATKAVIILLFLAGFVVPMQAQRIAVSTNIIDLMTLTPNVEVELPLNHKRSFALSIDANPFDLGSDISVRHLSVGGEYRFWIDQVMYANYIGVVAQLSSNDYNVGSYNLSGNMFALGISYGYSFLVNRNINIVPNVAFGCGYDFDTQAGESYFKPILLNLGISIQFLIK